jgi:hypothetical protein
VADAIDDELIARAREIIAAASPAPYHLGTFGRGQEARDKIAAFHVKAEVTADGAERDTLFVWVEDPEPPPDEDPSEPSSLVVALTGNGPRSEANARYILHSHDPIGGWGACLNEIERLRNTIGARALLGVTQERDAQIAAKDAGLAHRDREFARLASVMNRPTTDAASTLVDLAIALRDERDRLLAALTRIDSMTRHRSYSPNGVMSAGWHEHPAQIAAEAIGQPRAVPTAERVIMQLQQQIRDLQDEPDQGELLTRLEALALKCGRLEGELEMLKRTHSDSATE